MAWLGVDTSGRDCTVIVRRAGGGDCVRQAAGIVRGHDQHVAGLAQEALAATGVAPQEVTGVAVCIGPGSFAGVRVGVAFARGFAAVVGVEAVGVLALDVWARIAASLGARLTAGVHDAKRGEVSWRVFDDGAPLGEPFTAPVDQACVALRAIADAENTEMAIAGSGAPLVAGERLRDTGLRALAPDILLDLAACAPPQTMPAAPYYHRPPDAAPAKPRPHPTISRLES